MVLKYFGYSYQQMQYTIWYNVILELIRHPCLRPK